MNFMNRVKSIWMMLMLLTVFTVAAFAQDTYYVRNDAQGDNLTAVKNNPLKPYKTIAAAINAAAAGDIISVACMTYDEAQVTINKAVTLVSTPDNGLTVATINNGFIINKDAATINLGTGSSAGFLLKNGAAGALNLTAGILNITTANVTLVDGANVYRSAGSITAAPTFAKLVNVYYTGESKTAGPELPVDCKGGILNNGMIAGKTLTVNATLSAQDIQNVNGNITFNAKVVTEEISNMGTGTLNFAANVDLYANGNSLDNAGTIKLNSGVMTIVTEKNGIIINNAGKIISTTSKVVGDGVITFVGTTAKANTIVGEVPSLVIPAAYKGTITAAGPVSIVGEFKLESPVVAAFNDNGQTIEVYEDFLRLDNTIGNYVADGTLVFKGAANQVFNSGLQLAFTNVTIDNAVGTVTLTQAANVKVKLEIKAKGKLDLNGFNLLFDVPASSFVNNGYQTTGNGLIIVNHAGTTVFSGTGSFSNLDLRGGATVQLGSDVKFAGTMTLRNGILDLAAHTATLVTAAYASVPKVVFYANKASIINGGDFVLDEGVKYDLVYALSSDAVANFGFASTQEWINTGINNLTVQSDSKDYNLTVLAPNEATSVYGNLMVNKGQTLILNNKDLTFAGASTNHVVSGTIAKTAGTEVLIVKANNITLKGDAGVSVVPGIKINLAADQTFTSTGLKVINGNITNVNGSNSIVLANTVDNSITGDVVNTAGTLVLNLNTDKAKASTHVGNITVTDGKLTYTRGTVAAQQNLTGNVQIDGGTLSLGSAVKVSGTTLQNDGTLELGANNYAMVGAYTRVKGAVTASTGKMVVAYGASANFTPGAEFTVPNLEIACGANTATLNGNSINVANSFVQTSGTFALGDNNMVVDGNVFTYTAGGVTAGAGIVELKGASTVVTMAGNLTLANLTINTAGSVTLVSDDETKDNPTARTLTLTGAYYQKAGNLALGRHSIQINGSFTRDAGSTSMGTGYFILNGGPIAQGDNWSVDNLKVITGVTMADKSFSVNKNLVLSAVLNAVKDDNLVIGDGALIERNAIATLLTKAPKFAGKVNLLYSADGITTGKEVPTTDVITNVTVKGSTAIAAGTAVTVNGTLEIDGPHTLTLGDKDLSMADNSTLKLVDGDFATLISLNGKKFVEKGYLNIEYKNGTGIPIATSEVEFYSTAKIKNVTISGANDVKMHAARTINGTLLLTNTGNLDMNGFALTLKGDVTQQKAGFVVNGGVQKSLTFAGAAAQKVTLVAAWTVPTEITFVLNKDNKADLVTIAAKNIDFTTYTEGDYRLVLTKGLLGTEANNIIILKQGIKANSSPDQGYAQTDGVITGNVQKEIYTDNANPLLGDYAIARSIVTFPVGSDAGDKRDLSLFFKNKLESTVKFTVNHDSKVPGGSNGFPIANGNLKITNYSPFFWYIKSDVALAPSYKYDLELQGQGYIDYLKDKIQNVRMVRRDSGDVANNWILQGVGTNYDNATIATDWPSVKVIDAMGGITRQGSLFAYSQCNKAPIFTAKLGDVTVTETDTVKFTYAVSDADLGQKPVMFCKELPKNATFDKTTGKFFWATTYADSGKYSVTIGATDGIDTTLATASITVLNKKRPAYFVDFLKDCSIKNDSTFTFKYTAKDEDGDAFTFALTPITDFKGTSKLENGTLTLVPSFADAGKTYNVEVKLMSNTVAVETKTAKVTVEYSRKKGDVDGNGSVQAADASEVLKAVVGLKTLDAQATYAAEVTGDGVVGALDASYILSYCVNGKFPSVAELGKMAAVSGNVTFGTFASKEGSNVVVLPVNIVEANNVMSAKLTLNVDEKLVDVENVAANMPEGWLMVHNYANGQLTVVMAGVKSMTSGNMVNVNLTMKDKEAKVAVDGKISLNDAAETMLNKVTVKQVPAQFDLSQNYPNPFNPTTNIKYQLSADSKVTINVYNMLGQLVKTLFNGQQEAGYYTINWDGTNEYGSKVTSGVYIYRLETGSYVATKKMNLLK